MAQSVDTVAVPRRQMEQWIEMLRAVRPGISDASTRQTFRQIEGQLQRLIAGYRNSQQEGDSVGS